MIKAPNILHFKRMTVFKRTVRMNRGITLHDAHCGVLRRFVVTRLSGTLNALSELSGCRFLRLRALLLVVVADTCTFPPMQSM